MRARSFALSFLSFQSGLTSRFVDDLCQILGMFSLNSIGCVTKCGPVGILSGNTTDRCMWVFNVSNLHTERFEAILTAR